MSCQCGGVAQGRCQKVNAKDLQRLELVVNGTPRLCLLWVENGRFLPSLAYRDPNPVSMVRIVRNVMRMSSQAEKYLM
jgi:hypothetical protein